MASPRTFFDPLFRPRTVAVFGASTTGRGFANDFIHHPDRLTTPLIRSAEGELVPASWGAALERVVEGLQQVKDEHGSDALGFISSSRCSVEENYLMQKLARATFGTHNVHSCAAT